MGFIVTLAIFGLVRPIDTHAVTGCLDYFDTLN